MKKRPHVTQPVKGAEPVCSTATSVGLALAGEDAECTALGQGFWNRSKDRCGPCVAHTVAIT